MEKVRIDTQPPDTPDEGVAGLLADLRHTAKALRADEDAFRRLITDSPLYTALPPEAQGRDGIRPEDTEWLRRIGDDAVDLLESMLTEGRNR